MQLKSMVFKVIYKSKLLEISQQRRNRKVWLIAIHIGLPSDFFDALNLWFLIPMNCFTNYKME